MPIQNIPIPSYLEPPDQGQQEQLALMRQRMQQEAADKFAESIQKRVAMQKLIGDTRMGMAAGLDPQEAQQLAIADNAESLFPQDPSKAITFKDKALSAISRRRALDKYREELTAGRAAGMDYSEAAAAAWAKHGADINPAGFGANIGRYYSTDRSSDIREMEMENRRKQFEDREKRIREMKEADRASKEGMFNTRVSWEREKTDMTEQGKNERQEVSNEIAKRRVAVAEKRAEQPSSATLKAQRELDDEIRQVERNLKKHLSEAPRFFGKDSWQKTKEALEDDLRSLKAERAKFEGEASPISIGDNPQDPLGLFPK